MSQLLGEKKNQTLISWYNQRDIRGLLVWAQVDSGEWICLKIKIALPVGLGVLWDLTNFIICRQLINTMCSSLPRTLLSLDPVNSLNLRRIVQISKQRGVIRHCTSQKCLPILLFSLTTFYVQVFFVVVFFCFLRKWLQE